MIRAEDLYGLKLGESVQHGSNNFYRVPGGWMLSSYLILPSPIGVFIPMNREFDESPEWVDYREMVNNDRKWEVEQSKKPRAL